MGVNPSPRENTHPPPGPYGFGCGHYAVLMELNWAQRAIPVEVTELPSTGWSSVTVMTLIVSVLAIILSAVALGWQVYSWKHNGPKTKISADSGIAFGPLGDFEILSFSVSNKGRASTQISSVDFLRSDGGGIVALFPTAFMQGSFPIDLKPGQQESLLVRLDEVARICAENRIDPAILEPRARSGHGDVTGKSTDRLVRRLKSLTARHDQPSQ